MQKLAARAMMLDLHPKMETHFLVVLVTQAASLEHGANARECGSQYLHRVTLS